MLTSEANRFRLGLLIGGAGLALGLLLCLVELLHVPAGDKAILGLPRVASAERLFIFLFGAIHLLIAAIITVHRRTAT